MTTASSTIKSVTEGSLAVAYSIKTTKEVQYPWVALLASKIKAREPVKMQVTPHSYKVVMFLCHVLGVVSGYTRSSPLTLLGDYDYLQGLLIEDGVIWGVPYAYSKSRSTATLYSECDCTEFEIPRLTNKQLKDIRATSEFDVDN